MTTTFPPFKDSPLVFLVDLVLPDGRRARTCTGSENVGDHVATPTDLSVVDVGGDRRGLLIRTPLWTAPAVEVDVRIGVLLRGEGIDNAAWMYVGRATLADLHEADGDGRPN